MKRLALTTLLALSPLVAFAGPPSDAQVDKLLDVMRARQTLEVIVPQVKSSQQQMIAQLTAGKALTPEQKAGIDRIMARSEAQLAELMTWQKFEPLYRDIYRQTFDAADVDAMIAFYSSQAGRNLLDKTPLLMQNTMAAMQKMIVPMLQQMERDIAAEAAGGESTGSAKQR
jgi:hypothetical protein